VRIDLTQVDLIAQAVEALETTDPALADSLVDDIIQPYWDGLEPTDTDIYRARGGVLNGEAAA
jgi:hypothetical protein